MMPSSPAARAGRDRERLSTSDRASASRREESLFGFIVCTSFLDHAAGNDGHVHIAVHDRADHAADRAVDLAVHHAVEPDASVCRVAVNDVRHGERGPVNDLGANEQNLRQGEHDHDDGDDRAASEAFADAGNDRLGRHAADEEAAEATE